MHEKRTAIQISIVPIRTIILAIIFSLIALGKAQPVVLYQHLNINEINRLKNYCTKNVRSLFLGKKIAGVYILPQIERLTNLLICGILINSF
ncbi:hypothetical protein [Pedobacter endophyticus]|uniref:Uncharacterized protein n=1 Tax=Pedobacter endophyticus TaxID=2789740 RepID=A0A7S9PZY0_9SPHI|nr:hypothetical protein [Pedobacter endophyticus]QPH41058.1 hypothetical protein IZT61_07305 [Pedobacter endophyticus]